ncbi:sensor histidine kinase [Larkinella sp. VNQ87]|uniref:sensor histidine kinase n=1 Tax=Larkinella sp. VNQ87 TaxID=3400921 RepID=UPI003C06D3B5
MRDITGIRRYELWFTAALTVVYVVRRLIQEADRLNSMIEAVLQNGRGRPASITLRELANYNHNLNNNLALIAGVVFFLLAWFFFHYWVYPNLQRRKNDEETWLFAGLTLFFLVSSVAVYYSLKLYTRYKLDDYNSIIGLKVYSPYSKRNVLADTIGLAVLLLAYELLSQLGYFLDRKFGQEYRYVNYFFWIPLAALLMLFALGGHLPETLWEPPFGNLLMVLVTLIQFYILQRCIYQTIFPYVHHSRSGEFIVRILVYLLIWLGTTVVIWGARWQFKFPVYGLNLGLLLLTLFVPGLIALMRRVFTREKIQLQTQVSQTSAELAGLQSQINPHFLFNALNSLYATALQENSEKTADGIQKLGDMMRFMLQENNRDRIPLEKEIEYLRNYIQLQRMRLDESHGIEIRVTIQEPERDVAIAPMMLIPFVENAFKHGISLRKPSWIFITLTWDLTTLYFKVHNSRHPATASDPEKDRTGIGLENVRKRLELIYPTRHTLAIQASEQDYFIALTIRY